MADVLDLVFPVGGKSQQLAYQHEQPYTTASCENVRPFDVLESRLRGGSRPGTLKHLATQIGSGNPFRLLNSIQSGTSAVPSQSYVEEFVGTALAAEWSLWNYTFQSTAASLPTVESDRGILVPDGSAKNCRAILDAISYDADSPIEIETEIWGDDSVLNFDGGSSPGTRGTYWQLAFGLQNDTDYDGGCVVTLINADSGKLTLVVENQGSALLSTDSYSASGYTIRLRFHGGTLQVYLGSASNLVATVTGITLSGTQVGFAIFDLSTSTKAGFDNRITFRYSEDAEDIAEPALVASSNGSVYYEGADGDWTTLAGQDVDLASDRLLSSAERFGKLYIADYAVRAEGTDGVLSGSGLTFDSATYTDWSTLSIDTDGDAIELFSGGSGTYTAGVYAITAVASGNLTIADAGTSGTAIPFRVVRALKVFDPRLAGAGKLVKLAKTSGTTVAVPLGCTIACIWNDRLCLSGDPENPGDTFMSKQGDPGNWTEDTTATSPVFGEFDTNTRINEPVTALIPFARDYLVIGGISTINVVRGNPIIGGIVDSVSRTVGIVGHAAWCVTPDGFLVVMTGDGLYTIDPSATTAVPLSRDRLPREFIGLDNVNNDIQLGFDPRRNGIKIVVTPRTASEGTYYWFDWTTKTFWPESYPVTQRPTAMTTYVPSGQTTGKLVLGGADGYVRAHDDSAVDDDGTDFASHVLIGALALGGGGYFDGMLRECKGQLARLSGTVTAEVQVGDSIEAAFNATPRSAYTMRAGKGLSWHPRLRGNAAFIKLSSAGGSAWAYENLSVVRERLGKQRLLA